MGGCLSCNDVGLRKKGYALTVERIGVDLGFFVMSDGPNMCLRSAWKGHGSMNNFCFVGFKYAKWVVASR